MREIRRDGVPEGRDGTLKNPPLDHITYYHEIIIKVQ
jgi:hypothetical protein